MSALDRPVVVSRLVARYVVTGVVLLVVVAVVTAYVSRSLGVQAAIRDADHIAGVIGHGIVEPVLDDGVLTGDPAALATLDRLVRAEIGRGTVARVKLWDATGRIVYSDESRYIGDRFGLDPEEQESLRTGESQSEISDLTEPENRFEAPATRLLEVYRPIRTLGGTPVLFEAYFTFNGIAEAGRQIWLGFAPYSLGALLLLELVQIPLAVSLARRLRRNQERREELLRGALAATESERRRIAGDLHDGVVQDLAGVSFSLSAAARRPDAPPAEAQAVREAADQVRDAVRALRTLMVEIYPPNLAEEGLESALTDLLAGVEPRGLATALQVDAPLADLDRATTELFYRVAQEGVRNVLSHAEARTVEIDVTAEDGVVRLRIADDGRGLDLADLPHRPGHLGLRALGELAAERGATLRMDSTPGKGTVLTVEVPSP